MYRELRINRYPLHWLVLLLSLISCSDIAVFKTGTLKNTTDRVEESNKQSNSGSSEASESSPTFNDDDALTDERSTIPIQVTGSFLTCSSQVTDRAMKLGCQVTPEEESLRGRLVAAKREWLVTSSKGIAYETNVSENTDNPLKASVAISCRQKSKTLSILMTLH